MLLKIIKSPKVFLDLSEYSTEEAMSQVKSLREEFFNGNGKDVFPPVKIEEYHELQHPYRIVYINVETGQVGGYHGDSKLPSNCIAVVEHSFEEKPINIFITDDEEAYLIGDTGQTVSVINGKKFQTKRRPEDP